MVRNHLIVKNDFVNLIKFNIPFKNHDKINETKEMINFIKDNVDINLCMRYHSVMFSVLTNTRFVPVYSSSKIKNVLKDLEYDEKYIYEMSVDEKYRPININENKLLNCLELAYTNIIYTKPDLFKFTRFNDITNKILNERNNL